MDMGEWIAKNWAIVQAAPAEIISLALIFAAAGFSAAHFLSKHRIEGLKEQVDYWKGRSQSPEASAAPAGKGDPTFKFPPSGFYGPNLLGPSIIDMTVRQSYSMSAVIPDGKRLRVRMVGPRAQFLEDVGGAWTFSIGTRNWAHNMYDRQADEQVFEAGPGEADLQFFPQRPGAIAVELLDEAGEKLRQFTVRARAAE
jgi:hypothetical protein